MEEGDCIPSGEHTLIPDECCSGKVGIFGDWAISCIESINDLGGGACYWGDIINGEWYVYNGYTGDENDVYYSCCDGEVQQTSFCCEGEFLGKEMPGRITNSSVTVNLVPCVDEMSAYIEYGTQTGVYTHQTDSMSASVRESLEIVIHDLEPSTKYYYRVLARQGSGSFIPREEGSFMTKREKGESFVFDVTADIHFYEMRGGRIDEYQLNLLQKTLQNIKEDNPDFHIDLGDSFCTDYWIGADTWNIKSQEYAYLRYEALRKYLDDTHHSIPFFLVLGNYEGELGFNTGDLPQWSENARLLYIPNPDNTTYPESGSPHENYYAFTWGDALFVILDPFRYTTVDPNESGNADDWTLGSAQLQWLEHTLENSGEKYKFIFIHHLVGGCNPYGRGGAACAHNGEWGDAVYSLLVEHNVNVVFHGHDHAFADEIIEGVRYTLVPTPATIQTEFAWRRFYDWEKIISNPGHVRVTVDDHDVTVDYVYSSLDDYSNGQIKHSYNTGGPCKDSDGGKDYEVKGRTQGKDSVGNDIDIWDYCDSSTTLVENFCDGDVYEKEFYDCEYGFICMNGKCVDPNCKEGDVDSDGVGYDCDNCPDDYNPDQEDNESDGLGDICDPDDDNDTILDESDNCPLIINPNQEDGEGDRVGNLCDNCLLVLNGPNGGTCIVGNIGQPCMIDEDCGTGGDCSNNQEDRDGDRIGDACDNCPERPNSPVLGFCAQTGCGIFRYSLRQCTSDEDCQSECWTCQMNQEDNYPAGGNGIGDVCEWCYADVDGDGTVYPADLSNFLDEYGRTDCTINPPPCETDIDGDGNVYPGDLSVFLEEYGREDCPVLE